MTFRLRGVVLPEGEERELFVEADRITFDPVPGAETVVDGGWVLPGLADVHTHLGAERPADPLDDELRARGSRRRAASSRGPGVSSRSSSCRSLPRSTRAARGGAR